MKLFNKMILISFLFLNIRCTIFEIIFSPKSEGKVLFGYMDKKGKETIPPKYKKAHPFKEDLANVKYENNLWGFIDKKDNRVIEANYFDAKEFSEGLAAVKVNDAYSAKNWGYVNKTGEMVISPSFYSAGEFRNGIARVTLEYTKRSGFANHLHGYINKEGKIIATDKDRTTSLERDNHSYADGLLPVKTPDGWGFQNLAGEMITKDSYYEIRSFSEGMAAVAVNIDSPDTLKKFSDLIGGVPGSVISVVSGTNTVILWGYINTSGKMVIPFTYLQVTPFTNGFAVVNNLKVDPISKSGYFFINKKGENQYNSSFEFAKGFSSGLACVTSISDERGNTKSYYINPTGKKALDSVDGRELFSCEPFSDGVAFIRTSETFQKDPNSFSEFTYREGYIDHKGNPIYPLVIQKDFDGLRTFSNGMAMFNRYFKN